jgi:hypothetical protein
MLHNFTVIDVFGGAAAAMLLGLFVFVPGYVAGWLTNLMEFRRERPAMRVLLSTPLGVATVPVLVFLLGRYPRVLWMFFGLVWGIFAVLILAWERWGRGRTGMRAGPTASQGGCPRTQEGRRSWVRMGVWFALGWAVLALLSVADLQIGHRLYNSVTVYDHSVRTAMTAAAARGIPAANPFFEGHPLILLRYHYFWMMMCGLVTRLSGITPRLAMLGSTVWGGIALLSLIPIGLRYLAGVREGLGRASLTGFALVAVTGLDLLPVLYISHFRAPVYADMEWWNVQITSWVDAMLWTPHHVLAMIACVMGFLILRRATGSGSQRTISVIVAALAFGSACGLSVLVTLTFAAFIALWLVIAACRGWWDEWPLLLAAGVLAIVFSVPTLRMLFAPGAQEGHHSGFFALAVREFPLAMRMLIRHLGWRKHLWIANLLLLPLNYFLELGFFLLVAWLRLKAGRAAKIRLSREEVAAWVMVATSFLVGSFVRSNTLASNDIGWRCFLQAQFVLLLWGAAMLDRGMACPSRLSVRCWRVACAMLIVGVLGTAYQVVTLRLYDVEWTEADAVAGKRIFALRSVYEQLNKQEPKNAILQYNPDTAMQPANLLYSGHPAAVGMPRCGAVYGGQASQCEAREAAVDSLFEPLPGSAVTPESVCRTYGISVLVAADTDPVWKQPESWVWMRRPLLANPYVRAFRCGP